ncbi:MAG TPA: hypothetical protein DEP91_06150 [Sphingomonas bacterium]|uniref:DUF2336 domain-containing protein n=1 Tax=Sphingomonas bacterium TaxID=1895847 RepID=A0A3D0WAV8_9SPHN|nr:hypothetical protein [Sphingomonas bacterium]
MSIDPTDPLGGTPADVATLLAEADGAAALVRRLRGAAIRDLLIPDAARLDDRRRAALRTLIRAIVGTIGADIHDFALRRLTEVDEGGAAALSRVDACHLIASIEARLGTDEAIAGDLIDRVTLDLIGDGLPSGLIEQAPEPWQGRAAERAGEALRQAESRRRTPPDQPPYATDLPAESQAAFTWWIAAAIADVARPPLTDTSAALDRALADGAAHSLAQADEGERLEAAATRLAAVADLRGGALVGTLDHALAERRVVLLAALIAHAAGTSFDSVRVLMTEPADPRLWLLLRSLDLPRESIARIGFALCEADHRRDVERFADQLDAVMSLPVADAVLATAALRLPAAFRAARATGETVR